MHVYLFAQSFRVAIKVIMLAIKLEQVKQQQKKALSHVHTTLVLEFISVVSFPKCVFEPLEMRKYNCKDVCGSLFTANSKI